MEQKKVIKPKTLHVKETTLKELAKHGKGIAMYYNYNPPYIQCNKKGEVNWNTTSVYHAVELIQRNNVKILK